MKKDKYFDGEIDEVLLWGDYIPLPAVSKDVIDEDLNRYHLPKVFKPFNPAKLYITQKGKFK